MQHADSRLRGRGGEVVLARLIRESSPSPRSARIRSAATCTDGCSGRLSPTAYDKCYVEHRLVFATPPRHRRRDKEGRVAIIRSVIDERGRYGYRCTTALPNRQLRQREGLRASTMGRISPDEPRPQLAATMGPTQHTRRSRLASYSSCVYLMRREKAESVVRQLSTWCDDYSEVHLHRHALASRCAYYVSSSSALGGSVSTAVAFSSTRAAPSRTLPSGRIDHWRHPSLDLPLRGPTSQWPSR